MILNICITLSWWLYWSAEGMIQGWIWAGDRRETNGLIIGNKKPLESGGFWKKLKHAFTLPWDFHFVRVLEVLGIWLFAAFSFWKALSVGVDRMIEWNFLTIGGALIGAAFYEMLLNYVNNGVIYKETDYKWEIGGVKLPWVTGYMGLFLLICAGVGVWMIGIVIL